MIKKVLFLGLIKVILFGYQDLYFYNIHLNYKEYINGDVIDRDYSKYKNLKGIGYKLIQNYYLNNFNFAYGFNIEYASGNTIYDGSTMSGEKLKAKQKNVSILNIKGFLNLDSFQFILGYRNWHRGKTNYEGDYEEIYYWPYVGFGYKKIYNFEKFAILPLLEYDAAIDPKIDIKLGNNPTLNLGTTQGLKLEIPFLFKIDKIAFKIFYRFESWHINSSNTKTLIINNKKVLIFEPESLTINQYLGAGLLFKF